MNIAEILKDYLKGTKLYSPVCGECRLEQVDTEGLYPIIVTFETGNDRGEASFTEQGQYFVNSDGECMLWPSKDNHDWESMHKEPVFKPGDIVVTTCGGIAILDRPCETPEKWWYVVCLDTSWDSLLRNIYGEPVRLANMDEINRLFAKLIKKGLRYNSDTHELEEIKKEHIFQPYEKVLARDYDKDQWTPQIFSHYNNNSAYRYRMCGGMGFNQCISYEGNEHLVDNTKNAQ